MALAFATAVAKNYLPYARVLAESLQRFHPEIECFVALADAVEGCFDPAQEPFRLVALEQMAIPDLPALRFRYGRGLLAVAAKPYLLSHLLNRGFSSVLFLDPDMAVLASLNGLLEALAQHSLLLTPHLLEPPAGEEGVHRELEILRAGTFNGGVVGASERDEARRFLLWWQDRLWHHCEEDGAGASFDQGWLDLAPSFVADLSIHRDPGVNVGHWNLAERPLSMEGATPWVQGQPCRLLHCSGFDPAQARLLTRHGTRQHLRDLGPAAALLAAYRSRLGRAGLAESTAWPYAFARFNNAVLIPDAARVLYRSLGERAASFGDPSDASGPQSFYHWLTQEDPDWGAGITRLWRCLWQGRVDVQVAYADPAGANRAGFLSWLERSAGPECGVPAELLPPVQAMGA